MACTLDPVNGPWPPKARRMRHHRAGPPVGEPEAYNELPWLKLPGHERQKNPRRNNRRSVMARLPWLDPRWHERRSLRRSPDRAEVYECTEVDDPSAAKQGRRAVVERDDADPNQRGVRKGVSRPRTKPFHAMGSLSVGAHHDSQRQEAERSKGAPSGALSDQASNTDVVTETQEH